ncbi:MAG: hypothetical protein P4L54_07155 [Acidocella sp.]|nr:hypothetical protein [Acidocella sp.]
MPVSPEIDPVTEAHNRAEIIAIERDQRARQFALEPLASIENRKAALEQERRSWPAAEKQKLLDAGYRGDLSPLPPDENSGRISTEVRERRATITEHKHGDPRTWMNQFMPPLIQRVIAFREPGQDILDWNADCCDRHYNLVTFGSIHRPTQAEVDAAWKKVNGK